MKEAKAAKTAIDSIGVVLVEKDNDLMILPDELDAFRSFETPKEAQYSLISSIEGLLLLQRDLGPLLDDADRDRKVMGEKGMGQIGRTF